MSTKRNINEIKEKINSTRLVKISGLNKKELLEIEKKIDNYSNNKQINYKEFFINDQKIVLNDEQYKIVTSEINKNTRILACAGSGKTTTIICRIKYLIDKGISPKDILLTTFNVDAAENMKNKLTLIFGFLPNINIGTFDSIACKFYYRYFKKDHYVGISEYSTLLLNYIKSDEGINIYKQIKYIFFDEFQDCNHIQFEIIKELSKKRIYVTVIGDDAQNIYQWRGSNIDFILNFDKYIDEVVTYKLVNNYRSTPEIINISNISIKNNTDQIPKDMLPNNESINMKPEIKKYTNEVEQAEYVIDKILDYLEMGIKLDEISIISRNNYSLKIMEEQIEKFNKTRPLKISYVALISEDNLDTKPKIQKDHITLTSIHKSKGLEWKVVFLISCNDDKFPSEIDKISIQEERRLFYVCITRAKKYLHISFTNKTISRFIAEIPLEYFNFINFKTSYFNFQNYRNQKYKNDVTGLIEMIEPRDIEIMREDNIIPELFPFTSNVHQSYTYDENINKYYLHQDFGIFIDRYISRLIGLKVKNSQGLKDRTAEKLIYSLKLDNNLYSIYNKYQPNFFKKICKITQKISNSQYVSKINKSAFDPPYIKKIDSKDEYLVQEIVRLIVLKANKLNIKTNEILIIPNNYLPLEFTEIMEKSYLKYKNKDQKNQSIIKDIYTISLCENISDGRRRLLYKDVFNFFSKDINLFTDIENYVNKIVDHELICKKVIYNEEYDIVGEIDLIDITEEKIIDYKCSSSSDCKLEWILQLLTYTALLKLNNSDINIKYIEFYNPLLGSITTIDISGWKRDKILLSKLNYIRDRNLNKS